MGDYPHTHCQVGHALEGENVRVYNRGGKQYRECYVCSKERTRKKNAGRARVAQLARDFIYGKWRVYVKNEKAHPEHPLILLGKQVEETNGIPRSLREWTAEWRKSHHA